MTNPHAYSSDLAWRPTEGDPTPWTVFRPYRYRRDPLIQIGFHEYIGSGYRIGPQGKLRLQLCRKHYNDSSHQYISRSVGIAGPCRETDAGFMGVFESQCVQVSSVSKFFFVGLLMLHDPRNAHRTREMTADAAKIKSDIWSEAGTADEPGWRTNGIAEPGQEQHSSERH
ncbi:hypothetical protein EI94DRAFT_1715834 [Lactarius quietus]|nr:hypothetical protein EI94DRAFT_1715834 [Lactarius quietus]